MLHVVMATPISQVVHNLVSEKSGDYALRVAADRNEALARGQEMTRSGRLSLARTTGARGGEGESEGKGVHGRLEPFALGSFLRQERGWLTRGNAPLTEQWTDLRKRQRFIRPGNMMTRTSDFLPFLGRPLVRLPG